MLGLSSSLLPLLAAASDFNGWGCSVPSATVSVSASPLSYDVRVNGSPWLEGGDFMLHHGGSWLSVRSGNLALASFNESAGVDGVLGAFSSLTLVWSTTAVAGFPWRTTFTCYNSSSLIEFEQSFPEGASNISTFSGGANAGFYNFNVSTTPVSAFPCWELGPEVALSSLAHIEWAGEFAFHQNNWGVGLGGIVGGQLGGPVVLHEPSWDRSPPFARPPQAALLGFLDMGSFKDAILGVVPDPALPGAWRWAAGPQGQLLSLPAGFSTRWGVLVPNAAAPGRHAVYGGATGVTAAVYEFGATLRALAGTLRFAPEDDVGVSLLSGWTDNGAVLDGDYWTSNSTYGTGGGVFVDWKDWLQAQSIPVASFQLDPYWYMAGPAALGNWTPSESVFGVGGFDAMLQSGMRLTLYSCFWSPGHVESFFPDVSFVLSPKMQNFVGGPIARVASGDSLAFHAQLIESCLSWDCVGFESDFLDFNYFAFADGLQSAGIFVAFLTGMSDAGVAAAVPIQLCMPTPADVLLSVGLAGVTNIRASDDNDLTYASADRWRIGLTSLLHGALDVRPFFDGTWTHAQYVGADAVNVPYPPGYAQNATEMGVAISALSTGPVGLGDKPGFTNGSLALMACASNGVLLKPSLPATPLDLAFLYDLPNGSSTFQLARAEMWLAPSFIAVAPTLEAPPFLAERQRMGMGLGRFLRRRSSRSTPAAPTNGTFPATTPCPFLSLLAVDVPASLGMSVGPSDLTPGADCAASKLASPLGYAVLPWSPGIAAMAARCADGAAAAACVTLFSDAAPLPVATGVRADAAVKGAYHDFELFSLAPILANGYSLLGELGKFTRVSPVRFSLIASTAEEGSAAATASLSFVVHGAPGEIVDVAILVPGAPRPSSLEGAIVRQLDIAFPSGGDGTALNVVCEGFGPSASCAVSD